MKKVVLSLVALVALLLMIAWMAGLFGEKIQPGINSATQTNLGDPVAVIEAFKTCGVDG